MNTYRRGLRLLARLAPALFALGCNVVHVKAPIGGEAQPLDSDVWAGAWELNIDGEKLLYLVTMSEDEPGRLHIGAVDNSTTGPLKLERGTLWARPVDGKTWFLTTQEEQESTETQPMIFSGLCHVSKGQAILWAPDASAVSSWIERGEAPGTPGEDPILDALSPAQLDAITSPALGLLHWREPVILRKIMPNAPK